MRIRLLFILLFPLLANAQDKIVTNSKMIGIGATRILDTYLSQEHYSGTELRFVDHTIRQRPGRLWTTEIVHQGYFARSKPRSKDASQLGGMYMLSWGRHYNLHLNNIDLRVGGIPVIPITPHSCVQASTPARRQQLRGTSGCGRNPSTWAMSCPYLYSV